MVRGEREFRMQAVAERLLPKVRDIETLFGRDLNITKENVREQVSRRIDEELVEVGLTILDCASGRVAWDRVFSDAVFRRPPFEPPSEEKEKGFRDLVIGESFLQLVEDSPSASKACQLVLVTNDVRLTEMVRARTPANQNVKVLPDIAAVEEFINTLASEATEEYVQSLRTQAQLYFYGGKGKKTGLYYTGGVGPKASALLLPLIHSVPEGGDKVRLAAVAIIAPNFVGKKGQRITWVSRVKATLVAVKEERYLDVDPKTLPAVGERLMNLGMGPLGWASTLPVQSWPVQGLLSLHGTPSPSEESAEMSPVSSASDAWKTREVTIAEGLAYVEVQWAATVTAKKKLTHPKIVACTLTPIDWTRMGT
jgi:hypothetical protein